MLRIGEAVQEADAQRLDPGLGAYAPLRDGSIRIGGGIFGSLGIGNTGATGLGANAPIEWMAEGRFAAWAAEVKQRLGRSVS